MATEYKIQQRRDSYSDWNSNNPTLASAQIGVETDTNNFKVGDGSTAWNSLAYFLPPGMMLPFGNTTAPDGFLSCDGSAISRTTYAALFDAVGTTWGSGDGSTTFNVPDLRGAFVRGTGSHGSETMADGNAFAGPSVGSFEDDQMQGHHHQTERPSGSGSNTGPDTIGTLGASIDTTIISVEEAITDGTNGPPRTGDETRPFSAGVLWVIKT